MDDHQSHELLFIHLGDMQLNYKTSTTADSEENLNSKRVYSLFVRKDLDAPTSRQLDVNTHPRINFLVGQLQATMSHDASVPDSAVHASQGVCQLPERVDGSTLDHRRHHKAGVLRKELYRDYLLLVCKG